VPFLVKVAEAMITHVGYTRYHLIGHSMGGLTGLLWVSDTNVGDVG
jgi:pimeloyl-ACP methyl ester carboxylesterase